jgi:hypothetical protein
MKKTVKKTPVASPAPVVAPAAPVAPVVAEPPKEQAPPKIRSRTPGAWTYIVATLFALLVPFFWLGKTASGVIALVMFVLGIIVGVYNIRVDEISTFLISAIALLLVIVLVLVPLKIPYFDDFVYYIGLFIAGSIMIAAIKGFVLTAKDD